jgi:uncharacterized membrane protein YjfL (UPF0719 family)
MEAKKMNFNFLTVDKVANVMPWAGSAIPAVMTVESVQKIGFQPWQAWIIGLVVEGLGFVAVTTTVDFYENGAEQKKQDGAFWVSLSGTLIYALVIVLLNAVLHQGSLEQKFTIGLLSLFGLLGGLMVALRNQLAKRHVAKAQDKERVREEDQRAWEAKQQIERDQLAFEQRLKEENMRLQHELDLKKLDEKSKERDRKHTEKVAETFQVAQESSQKVPEGSGKLPETFRKFLDWRKVPESERKVIAALESPEKVQEIYGGSLKTCENWWRNASKQFGGK